MGKPSGAQPEKPKSESSFRGIAAKLGTTPDALESAFATAKAANPKLTRGQFVSANMVAHNLGSKNPAITTQAILSGLQGGKSLGQTLQGLGLSADAAGDAEKQARHDAIEAQKPATP
jgi:predicted amino acid dehydrogenase